MPSTDFASEGPPSISVCQASYISKFFIIYYHTKQSNSILYHWMESPVAEDSLALYFHKQVARKKFLKSFLGDSPFLAVFLLAKSLSVSGKRILRSKSLHNQGIKLSSCSNNIGLMLKSLYIFFQEKTKELDNCLHFLFDHTLNIIEHPLIKVVY